MKLAIAIIVTLNTGSPADVETYGNPVPVEDCNNQLEFIPVEDGSFPACMLEEHKATLLTALQAAS